MKIVGLAGKKGSGKDTAALALIEDGWTKIAFADALRDMLYTLNPLVSEESWGSPQTGIKRWAELYDNLGYDRLKTLPEARRLMQTFGTEVMRNQFGENVWVNLAMKRLTDTEANYVFTDVRFANEAAAINARGGTVMSVLRPTPLGVVDTHVSESWEPEDEIIVLNDKSIADLHSIVRSLVANFV